MKQETYQDLEKSYPDKEVDIYNSHMQDWVFHYNIFTHSWAAIPRECYNAYWTDYNHPEIIRSSSIETLIDLVGKIKYDPEFLDKIGE